jgi:hypothetical protein
MPDVLLTGFVKYLGDLLATVGNRALQPVDETRKHSYLILEYFKAMDVQLARIDDAVKLAQLSKRERSKIWGVDSPLGTIRDACLRIGGLIYDIEQSIGRIDVKYKIYGPEAFSGDMDAWFQMDYPFMLDVLEVDSEAVLRRSSEEWSRDIDNLRSELGALRQMVEKFIRENYKLAERSDGR